MLKKILRYSVFIGLLSLLYNFVQAQQLLLTDTIATTTKAALLEVKASKQGLLLPRIQDTAVAPLNTSPDGMLIYHVPSKSLLIRRNGAWAPVKDSASLSGNNWLQTGNAGTDTITKFLGTTDAKGLVIRTGNTQRITVSSTGNVGVGTNTPGTTLHVKSVAANQSGIRIENLTSASPVTTGAGALGVDASGNVVRAAPQPLFYNGAGAVSNQVKIWADSITTNTSGVGVANISSAGFTKILSIQLQGRGGASSLDTPLPFVLSYSLTTVNITTYTGTGLLLGAINSLVQATSSFKIFVVVTGY
ncbi:hypothetical protein [Chitinophaga solisilvae]|uniref:hypothetical protein n=1 Tax=Chitinophaga solisilvae TaxID=1233460 RepID=UPI0013701686|nr:hypothetical protein [Chitinophaga solisilvae]